MSLKEIVRELERKILLSEKISKKMKAIKILDKNTGRISFFMKRSKVVKKLVRRKYRSNEELRRDLEKINFDLMQVSLKGANLSNLNLSNVNFSGADLSEANLSGSNLSNTNMSPIRFNGSKQEGLGVGFTSLSGVDASGADFSSANLSMARFSRARLVSVTFINADLSMADLSDCNLTNADFASAVLESTIFTNSILKGTGLMKKQKHNENYTKAEKIYMDEKAEKYMEGEDNREEEVYRNGKEYVIEDPYRKTEDDNV